MSRNKNTLQVKLTINGKLYEVASDVPLTTSLNNYLVRHANLKDTKTMCREGGCGACIVSATYKHPVSEKVVNVAVNSCLVLVHSCHNWKITTVTGLGNKKTGYHSLQTTLAKYSGTQCGYCSPGMIMNMHCLMNEREIITTDEIENSFGGNICRCTGYRPILDAFKSLATDAEWTFLNKVHDIEDLNTLKSCSKLNLGCRNTNMHQNSSEYLKIKNSDVVWYKTFDIESILKIMRKHKGVPVMLIAGNTAQGVIRATVKSQVYIDVNDVAELKKCSVDKFITLGGNVTLAETMKYLIQISGIEEFKYVENIVDHMDLVANIPVRNIGTIAGNLSIKHNNIEFQSDIFLLFETVGAFINLVRVDRTESEVTPSEYLLTDMSNKIIANISLPPINGNYAFKSYKIMPIAQNARAYVNAGFLIQFNNTTGNIRNATLVYGGINSSFVHATKTESLLDGINIFDNSNLRKILDSLHEEINPDWNLPDVSPEFRKLLAICLFYKFVLNMCPKTLISVQNISGSEKLIRELSRGEQKYQTNQALWPLQEPVPKLEALYQCAGEAEYVPYIPLRPGELFGVFVLAKKPLTTITNIDAKDALNINGVIAFLSAKDIPGTNSFVNSKMILITEPEEIFCSNLVKYYGQPVGLIVAETQELAEHASQLVRVEYSSTGKTIYVDVRDVLEHDGDGPRINFEGGNNAESKGNDIAYSFSGFQYLNGQYHFSMETQSAVCIPTEDGIDVYPSSQAASNIHTAISEVLNIPKHKINIFIRRLGGSFGSRISRNNLIASACALAAHLLNKPVRIFMGMQDNMDAIGKRNCCFNKYDVAVNKEGQIQYLKNDVYEDLGYSRNEKSFIAILDSFRNCYDTRRFTIKCYSVLTEKPSSTWTRAPGAVDGIAMIENIMEHIAHVIGVDPLDVRIANMVQDSFVHKTISDFRSKIDYDKRREEINDFNSKNRWRKRGISVIPMIVSMVYYGNQSAMVCIYRGDGTVSVSHSGVECGQGINTKVAQVCAYTLNLPLHYISIKPMNNIDSPNSEITGGSITSESCAFATMGACNIILDRLKPIKDALGGNPKWTDLIEEAYKHKIELQAIYTHKPDSTKIAYKVSGLSACEVEIDILTGNSIIKRVDIQQETGESMSPEIDIGQVEGAFIMGLGYWLCEKLVYDKTTGELKTNRTWNYKIPGAKDIPVDFRIEFIKNKNNDAIVLRSKATGEPSITLAFVAVCAIRHALQSARTDANGGKPDEWFSLGAPTTPEDILLHANIDYRAFTI